MASASDADPDSSGARADDRQDDRIGELVDDRYRILEAMASGAMGAVYRAEREPVGKAVAIKFLHASYAKDSEFLIRFERETRAMSKLAHPNCVSVVDFGVWRDAPYLVMEYVAGITLRKLLDEQELAPARALGFARQIAAGLAHAHAQGIVHRDVKPANIMVSDEIGAGEHIRLLDFGLARLRGMGGRDATLGNVVVGTPNYMAPEQTVPGATLDARTDIYAAGVLLFEMIAGKRPYYADDTMTLFGLHRGAPIPKLVDVAPAGTAIPDGVQAIVERAMAKDPKARYQSAVELAAALEGVLEGGRVEAALRQVSSVFPAAIVVEAATTPGTGPTVSSRPRSDRAPIAEATSVDHPPVTADAQAPAPARTGRRALIAGAIGLALAGALAVWLLGRGGDARAPLAAPADAGRAIVAAPDASTVVAVVPVAADAASVAEVVADSGAADSGAVDSGAGSGSGIELDPATAEDPDPRAAQGSAAEDEAADAPRTTADAERRAPASPTLATTIPEALDLIRDGKRDLALASLRALGKQQPASAYLQFLLGNLYFDQRWWSVAMDHYRLAIAKNPQYRGNPTLNRNVIRMLASPKTVGPATTFLRKTIGHAAAPYLKAAAAHEDNKGVRERAGALAKQIK